MTRRLNIIGFDTHRGFRTAELLHGDLTELSPRLDVLVVSAYAASYFPMEGSVIRALLDKYGIDSEALAGDPSLDFRQALGVWLSSKLENGPSKRNLYVEMRGAEWDFADALKNVFSALLAINGKGIPVSTIAMPLLGSGLQGIDPKEVVRVLVPEVSRYLEMSPSTDRVVFVEKNAGKAALVSAEMDRVLGRRKVAIPQQELVDAIRSDVRSKLGACALLFNDRAKGLHDDWIKLLDSPQVGSVEFGILARKLVEHLVERFGAPRGTLADRIRAVERAGEMPPWICGYMQVLRHLGNDAAHSNQTFKHVVMPSDLVAGLHCVQRILDYCGMEQDRSATE